MQQQQQQQQELQERHSSVCVAPASAINAVCNKSRLQLVRVYDFRLRGRRFSA